MALESEDSLLEEENPFQKETNLHISKLNAFEWYIPVSIMVKLIFFKCGGKHRLKLLFEGLAFLKVPWFWEGLLWIKINLDF